MPCLCKPFLAIKKPLRLHFKRTACSTDLILGNPSALNSPLSTPKGTIVSHPVPDLPHPQPGSLPGRTVKSRISSQLPVPWTGETHGCTHVLRVSVREILAFLAPQDSSILMLGFWSQKKMTGEGEEVVLKGDPYYSEGDLQVCSISSTLEEC